jgi:hypothetical protein
MMRTQIWSSGGGVQSSAIAALICQGELAPDLSVIIDTERELSTTWDYLDSYVLPALIAAGVELHRVKKSDFATVDLMRNDSILIPAFTTESGEIGKLPTYCSNEWKQRVMRRWAVAQGIKKADVWIGFTIDEMRRVTQPIGKWQHKYPLIERRMTRGDCIALVKIMGWPEPPRSSCYICPNKPDHEWEWQRINAPADHKLAISFEKNIQVIDPDLWLTKTGKPLGENDFSAEDDLFAGRCDSGMCFV